MGVLMLMDAILLIFLALYVDDIAKYIKYIVLSTK